MISSGVTGVSTATNAVVTVITAAAMEDHSPTHIRIENDSSVVGFFSVDGGVTWIYLKGDTVATLDQVNVTGAVQLKRITGGTNVTDVYAVVW